MKGWISIDLAVFFATEVIEAREIFGNWQFVS